MLSIIKISANYYVQSVSTPVTKQAAPSASVPQRAEMSSFTRPVVKKSKRGPDYDASLYTSPLDGPHIGSGKALSATYAAYRDCSRIVARIEHDEKQLGRFLGRYGELTSPNECDEVNKEAYEEPGIHEGMNEEPNVFAEMWAMENKDH